MVNGKWLIVNRKWLMEKNSNLAELYAKRSQMKDIGIMLFCCLKMKFFEQLSNTDPCPKHQSIAKVWSLSRSRPEADPSSIKSRNRLQPSAYRRFRLSTIKN